eukprot:4353938-Prymnesium_polylepis.2
MVGSEWKRERPRGRSSPGPKRSSMCVERSAGSCATMLAPPMATEWRRPVIGVGLPSCEPSRSPKSVSSVILRAIAVSRGFLLVRKACGWGQRLGAFGRTVRKASTGEAAREGQLRRKNCFNRCFVRFKQNEPKRKGTELMAAHSAGAR